MTNLTNMSVSNEFLLSIFETFYNNPRICDTELIFNGVKYYVISDLFKTIAPKLYAEIKTQTAIVPSKLTLADMTPDEVITQLTFIINETNKKVVTINEPGVSNEVVGSILESFYGNPFVINSDNLRDIHLVATRFGMIDYAQKCVDHFTRIITVENVIQKYQEARDKQRHTLPIMKNMFNRFISYIPMVELYGFTSSFTLEEITELAKCTDLACSEDVVYVIVDRWCKDNVLELTLDQIKTVLSHIKLDALSIQCLVSHVKTNKYIDTSVYVKALETVSQNLHRGNVCLGRKQNVFILGKLRSSYPGYRLVTKEDVTDKFRELLVQEYERLDGILSLDDITSPEYICCSANNLGIPIGTRMSLLHGKNLPYTKNKIYQLFHSCSPGKFQLSELKTLQVSSNFANSPRDTTGLFVVDTMSFSKN